MITKSILTLLFIIIIVVINVKEKNKSEKLFFLSNLFFGIEFIFNFFIAKADTETEQIDLFFNMQTPIVHIFFGGFAFIFLCYLIELFVKNEKAVKIINLICKILSILYVIFWIVLYRAGFEGVVI